VHPSRQSEYCWLQPVALALRSGSKIGGEDVAPKEAKSHSGDAEMSRMQTFGKVWKAFEGPNMREVCYASHLSERFRLHCASMLVRLAKSVLWLTQCLF
jgi:hypothetical protein